MSHLDVAVQFLAPTFTVWIELESYSVQVALVSGGQAALAVVEFGEQGEAGATGPAGPQGLQGVQGPAGATGLGFVVPDKQRAFNKFRTPGLVPNWTPTGLTTTALRLVACMCRLPSHGNSLTHVEMQVGAAVSGAVARVGIYSVGSSGDLGGMGETLFSSADFDASTTGVKRAALSTPITADGSLIVLSIVTNAAIAVRNFTDSKMPLIQLSVYDSYSECAKYTALMANVLPAQLPVLPTSAIISQMPAIGFGVA